MKKAGIGHIEMILAFLIFVSSVMFIFYYFNVSNVTANNDAMLAFLELEIAKKTKIDVMTATFVVNTTFTQTLGDPAVVLLKLPEALPAGQGVRAETYEHAVLLSSIDFDDRSIVYVDRTAQSVKSAFIRLIASVDTPAVDRVPLDARNLLAGTPPAPLPKIIASSVDTQKIYSEKQLKSLKASYDYNYIAQRKALKLSDRIDFSFKVVLPAEGNVPETLINAEHSIPSGVSVSALNRRVEVLRDLDGHRVFADLGIRVW